MRPLTSSQLLRVWEEGLGQPLADKTFRLLAVACGTTEYTSLGRMSIGERDARLLQLREWMFGHSLHNMANCPACGELVEWESDTNGLHLQPLPPDLSPRTFFLEEDGYHVQFRLPGSNDIAAIPAGQQNADSYRSILSRCVLKAEYGGVEIGNKELPDHVLESLNRQMSREDPQADIRMGIQCPVCAHQWEARFDIVSFLWAEINHWAQRMLREVYLLAKAFSWREADILEMSPRRRQFYLQMLGT